MLCTVADTNRGSEPTLIANNIIIGNNSNEKNTVSTNYALYVFGNLRIVHNTIYQAGNGAGCLCGNGYLMNFDIRGNQLVCSKYNQYPMRLVPASQNYKYWKGKTVTDYNNYYSQFGIVACIGDDDIQSVSELQEVTKGDLHSLCLPVSWTTEMQPQDIAPFLMPNIGLAEDANGRLRGTVTAMGAHTPLRTDAALTGFGPTVIANGSCTIYALLVNNGIDTLKQLDIHWTYNETTQPPFRWNGSLPIGAADTIRLGSISAVGGKSTRLAAWVVSPNGSTDMNPANDTARLLQFICNGPMSGTYNVGQSGSTDFKEMGEALLALNQCGVNGAVTLELQSCTYRQLNISDSISGSSSRHPITIKAAANAQVVIDNDTAGASLVVENAQHWVFDNLTIGNCTNGLVGVRLTGDNRDITFIRCRIYSSCTATGTDYRCVENVNTENSYKMLSDIHFEENEIRGGCYNFYFSYGASTLGQLSGSSIYIDRNRMSEAYSCCISALRNNHFKSISGNLFQCRKNTKSFYAIYARYYSIWEEIVGNRFHLTAPEGSVYAIQMGEFTQYGYTTPGIFANNEMIIRTERGCYALHALGATDGGWEIHHNTFLLNSTILSPNGVYLSNSNEKVPFNFTRNIVVVTDTVHNSIALSFVKGDRKYGLREYNNLYSTGNVASLGNSSTKYKTISDLQAVSGQDANSISVNSFYLK